MRHTVFAVPARLDAAWNSVSLRNKITGVTVLVLTFGLLMSGIGTTLLFKPVLLAQMDQQLDSAAQASNINAMLDSQKPSGGTVADDGTSSGYFVALYDATGKLRMYNWRDETADQLPAVPTSMTLATGEQCAKGSAFDVSNAAGDQQFRARCSIITFTDTGQQGTAIVATSTSQISSVMASYLTIFLGFSIIVVVVGAILTRMLVTTTFQPLREVELTAAAIADGDYSQRLGGAEPNTEVGRLNSSLNTMLSRIDRAFRDRARTIEQMRRFVGDASHELRTPLVSVRGYAELYRMGALATPDDVAQAMDRIEKEAIRMGGLVEDLLELARLDETRPLELVPVDLLPLAHDAALDAGAVTPERQFRVVPSPHVAELRARRAAEDAAGSAQASAAASAATTPGRGNAAVTADRNAPAASSGRGSSASAAHAGATQPLTRSRGTSTATGPIVLRDALARLGRSRARRLEASLPETRPIELVGETGPAPTPRPEPAIVLGEENKLRQVLANLITNAVRYTPPATPIEIGVGVDTASRLAVLEIVDHGDGIPSQLRERIFQRFWRADTSRTRETGGSGLGLAIVSSIVSAHRGQVEVVDTPGGGATFRVSLPLAGAQQS